MEDNNNSFVETMYGTIYEESINAYDNIIRAYPNFQEDMRNTTWVQKWKYNNPSASDVEMVAHAYTTMILTHLLASCK